MTSEFFFGIILGIIGTVLIQSLWEVMMALCLRGIQHKKQQQVEQELMRQTLEQVAWQRILLDNEIQKIEDHANDKNKD